MLCCTPSVSLQQLLCFLATTGSVLEGCVSGDRSSVTSAALVAQGQSVCSCNTVIWEVMSVDVPREKKLIFVELARNQWYSKRANTETIQTTVHFYELQKTYRDTTLIAWLVNFNLHFWLEIAGISGVVAPPLILVEWSWLVCPFDWVAT